MEKQNNITYYECVFVALDIQSAMPVRLQYIFLYYCIKGTIFKKNIYWTPNVYFDFLHYFFWNICHSKKNWVRCDQKCVIVLHMKYWLFLSDFNENRIFCTYFRKIITYLISWESVHWKPSCSMRRDRRTDWQTGNMTKLIVAFRSFAMLQKKSGELKPIYL